MIDKNTRAMIDTFRSRHIPFSSKTSKVSEPRGLKHKAKFLKITDNEKK